MTTVWSLKQPWSQSKMEPELRHSLHCAPSTAGCCTASWHEYIYMLSTCYLLSPGDCTWAVLMLPTPCTWPGTPAPASLASVRLGCELRLRLRLPYSFSPVSRGLVVTRQKYLLKSGKYFYQ